MPSLKRKIISGTLLLFLLVFIFSLLVYFTESPILLFKPILKNKSCAALAIRDDVVPFQKFGTRVFTYPCLSEAYAEVIYLTEYGKNEKHDDFVRAMDRLLSDHDKVDLFLLAHANEYYRWVQEIDSLKRQRIRMVYNTGCSGAGQCNDWLGLGAKSYVAHRSNESISPVFYFYFLRRWCSGENLGAATREANLCMKEKLERLAVNLDTAILSESRARCFGVENYAIYD